MLFNAVFDLNNYNATRTVYISKTKIYVKGLFITHYSGKF